MQAGQKLAENHGLHWSDMSEYDKQKYRDEAHAATEGRSVVLMGPYSPFWRCQYCQATALSPVAFEHKADCFLHTESR